MWNRNRSTKPCLSLTPTTPKFSSNCAGFSTEEMQFLPGKIPRLQLSQILPALLCCSDLCLTFKFKQKDLSYRTEATWGFLKSTFPLPRNGTYTPEMAFPFLGISKPTTTLPGIFSHLQDEVEQPF